MRNGKILIVATMLFLIGYNPFLFGQEETVLPEESVYKEPKTKLWINTYGKIRISNVCTGMPRPIFALKRPKLPRS